MNDENAAKLRDLAERTKRFALRVVAMYSTLPKSTEAQVMGKQVLRSGTLVGANYREANRARSKAEFIAKLGDSLKELDETSYWLDCWLRAGSSRRPSLRLCRTSAINSSPSSRPFQRTQSAKFHN